MEQLIQALASAAQTAAGVTGEQLGVSLPSLFEQPEDSAVGDLALPCFRLAKALRKSPAVIAADLAETIVLPDGVARAEAVNGYLNFFVDPAYYAGRVGAILQNPDFGTRHQGAGKTMVIDYSSPNIAKRFHVGHLGTTVIGNAIKNLHAFCGYRCVGINYLGDWGTQFGKLIVAYKKWSSADRVAERGIEELVDIYVRFSDESEKEPSLNDQARAAFAELERGNEEYLAIWRYFKEISLREYMKTYELLGIEFDSFDGESFFTDKMPAIVEELREKGLLVQDDGAWIVDLAPYGMPPALILKRDGSTLYPTRDIAAAVWRKKEYDFDKCIYVTSAGQSLHFAQWFKVVELMGYDWADRLVHVPYGTMSVGGEKLASRTGNVILLDDLFAEAISKAEAIMEEKNASLPNRHETAVAVGTGAVIFNALSGSRIKDTNFTWENALSFDGNTGPYVQYTYARASSVLRRAACPDADAAAGYVPAPDETALVKTLLRFPARVDAALCEYEPSIISRYVLDVCAAYNVFYHNCPILRSSGAEQAFRLRLTAAARQIIGKSLDLLTIRRTEEI